MTDQETFEQAVLRSWAEESGAKSFVLFSSPTCGPCKGVKMSLGKLEDELKVSVAYVNVFHAQAAAAQSSIRAVPTLIRFERGVEVSRIVGAESEQKLREFLHG